MSERKRVGNRGQRQHVPAQLLAGENRYVTIAGEVDPAHDPNASRLRFGDIRRDGSRWWGTRSYEGVLAAHV